MFAHVSLQSLLVIQKSSHGPRVRHLSELNIPDPQTCRAILRRIQISFLEVETNYRQEHTSEEAQWNCWSYEDMELGWYNNNG